MEPPPLVLCLPLGLSQDTTPEVEEPTPSSLESMYQTQAAHLLNWTGRDGCTDRSSPETVC